MRPQIYEATTGLGGKNTFRNQQEVPQEVPQEIPQEISQEIPQEIPQENSEKHPDHTFKVITYPKASVRTSRILWTSAMQPIAPRKEEDQEHEDHD